LPPDLNTGNQPPTISLPDTLFDRLCAGAAAGAYWKPWPRRNRV